MRLLSLDYNITDELKQKLLKLSKKDITLKKAILKKITQIINSDNETILHYKFLRYDSKERQRVHIMKHFVLIFKYYKNKKFILFIDFDHHNKIYKN